MIKKISSIKKKPLSNRYLFLDVVRGIAVILMIFYHIIFDLNVLYGIRGIDALKGFWYYEGRISAILFIGISGVSTAILFNKYDPKKAIQKNIKRTIKILFWALCITAITFFIQPDMTIHFGILHFIGLSTLLSMIVLYFVRLFMSRFNDTIQSNLENKSLTFQREANVLFSIGLLWLIVSNPLLNLLPHSYQFFLLGSPPETYSSWDYYPLFPYFGIVLIGLAIGIKITKSAHDKKKDTDKNNLFKNNWTRSFLENLGKKSLFIYLLHQPIIILFLKGILLLLMTF